MPKLRPAPTRPEETEDQQTYYGAEKPKEPFESKDEVLEADVSIADTAPKKEPVQDDPSLALKKQIEDLRRSEQLAREDAQRANQEREDALRRASERERESFEFRKEIVGSRMDAIKAGIAAAQAEAESAQRDLENAVAIGDSKAQAESYRKLARAEANLSKMEDGKAALEEELQRQSIEKAPTAVDPNDIRAILANSNLPELAKSWLEAHPDYLKVPRKNAKIQALHWDLVDEGHAPFSREYFESMEVHLGLRKAEKVEDDDDDDGGAESRSQDQKRGTVVSAPVSREAPAGSRPTRPSQIRLTKAQVEAARMAGVTEAEYAKQLIKLGEFKADGHYGESR
jgi:hypothetical protein